MRFTITCEECGFRQKLERYVYEPGPIEIVCHGCEQVLKATVTAEVLAANTGKHVAATWGAILGDI